MKTLIIYDNTGKIYYMASGDYTKPDGLPYIEVEVPEGYYVASVDVETNTAVFKKHPVNNTTAVLNALLTGEV